MQNRMSPGLSPTQFFGNLIRKIEFKILRRHRKKYKKKCRRGGYKGIKF